MYREPFSDLTNIPINSSPATSPSKHKIDWLDVGTSQRRRRAVKLHSCSVSAECDTPLWSPIHLSVPPTASGLVLESEDMDILYSPGLSRLQPDPLLLKGDNQCSVSFSGSPYRSPYRAKHQSGVSRSLNDSWSFYRHWNSADSSPDPISRPLVLNPTKSVLTIDAQTSQILTCNTMACELLGVRREQMFSVSLRQLLVDDQVLDRGRLPLLQETHLCPDAGDVVLVPGTVVEMRRGSGETVSVSLWLRRVLAPSLPRPRCVAVIEPVDQISAEIYCERDSFCIRRVSESTKRLFSLSDTELCGKYLTRLLPTLSLPRACSLPHRENVSGRRADGSCFPVTVTVTSLSTHNDFDVRHMLSVKLTVYTSLMGLIVTDENFTIVDCNQTFVSLATGFDRDSLIGESLSCLIPTLCEDIGESSECDSVGDTEIEKLYRAAIGDQDPSRPSIGDAEHSNDLSSAPVNQGAAHTIPADTERLRLRDDTYYGMARHRDGTDFNVTYDLCGVRLGCGRFVYCFWIGRDRSQQPCSRYSFSSHSSHLMDLQERGPVECDGVGADCSCVVGREVALVSDCDEHVCGGYRQHYTTVRQIGRGAFGFVKLSYRNKDRLLVVTKFIAKVKISADNWVDDPALGRLVPLEVSLLCMLRHRNIIGVLDVYENEHYIQLVMERHGCMDLFEFIERNPALDEPLASYIFRQICSAVNYLHQLEILHRDVKDENVIIDSRFCAKLIDFGSATFVTRGTLINTFGGTVEYCAPEVLLGHRYDGYSMEMWSLGVTLYTLVCRENPFRDVLGTVSRSVRLPENISPDLNHLLSSLLEKSAAARISMTDTLQHSWTIQPVHIDKYKFSDVVPCCSQEEDPPRHMSVSVLTGAPAVSNCSSPGHIPHTV